MTEADGLTPDDDALAAEYVLGVLPHGERLDVISRLQSEPDLRALVAFWEHRLVPLTLAITPETPPRRVYAAIERRLFAPETPRAAPWGWRGLVFWQGLSAASLAALAVMAGLYFMVPAPVPLQPTGFVAELSGEAGAVRLVAFYDAASGQLRLNRTEGTAATGRAFELWLIAGPEKPVSLGVLPADARTVLSLPEELAAKLGAAVLAISDEPAGGSATGLPTGAVLATGKVSAI